MNKEVFLKLTIVSFLSLWFVISVFRLGYNYFRFFTEERSLIFETTELKRHVFYGETYTVIKELEKKIPEGERVLFISDEGFLYYLGRYLLYPRKVYWIDNLPKQYSADDFTFIFVSDLTDPRRRELKFKKEEILYNTQSKKPVGIFYKR